MKIVIPPKVKFIINTLEAAGYEAYIVGGCVRDSLMGVKPFDWDLTTSALPMQVKALFKRTIDTGIEHGTVSILLDKAAFEVTTYRVDGEYEDSRHPKKVEFTPDLEQDLKRRDFTINAMAYNEKDGLIDIFEGAKDMDRKIIRAVGIPKERFQEDALRMLRALRFSAKLDYKIENKTEQAIKTMAQDLANISVERIQMELVKLLTSNHPEKIVDAYKLGVTKVVLPEFDKMMETKQNNPHHIFSVGEHCVQAMMGIRPEKTLRLTMLLHDCGKVGTKTTDEQGIDHFGGHAQKSEEISKNILKRLHFDNETIYYVSKLVLYHDYCAMETKEGVRKAIHQVGEDIFPLLLEVQKADVLAQSMYMRQEKTRRLDAIKILYKEICDNKECVSIKMLEVSGKELILWGMRPGKEIGSMLEQLLEWVLVEPSRNEAEQLKMEAKRRMTKVVL